MWVWIVMGGLYLAVGVLLAVVYAFMASFEAGIGNAFGYPSAGPSILVMAGLAFVWPLMIVLFIVLGVIGWILEKRDNARYERERLEREAKWKAEEAAKEAENTAGSGI